MDRRDFFKTVAITGAAMTIQRSEAMEILTQTINKANGDKPDLVAVMGGEPEVMFRRAISELGGMKQFIKPGQKVVVKPNIGWDKVPELAGNTNPKLITEIIKQCFAAGAKEVTVFDHTCDDWQKCYKNSGIEAAAKEAGAKVMPAHLESYYKPIDLPKGQKMKKLISSIMLALIALAAQAQILTPVKWKIKLDDKGGAPEKEIVFTATADKGWHLYDMNLPEGGPVSTSFTFETLNGAELIGQPVPSVKPTTVYDEQFAMNLRWYPGTVSFTQKLKVTDPAKFKAEGEVEFMACNDETCLPPDQIPFSFDKKSIHVDPALAANSSTTEVDKEDATAIQPDTQVVAEEASELNTPDPAAKETPATTSPKASDSLTDSPNLWSPVIDQLKSFGDSTVSAADTSWLFIFFAGFLGGLIALLTPCVWPMIPMTVSFFLKRTKDRKKAIRDAITYGLSIIVIYLVMGLLITGIFGASALNDLSTNAIFNILFFLLLVVFAVSFFGAFELVLPASWTSKLDSKADSTTGVLSIFFMSFTLVLVSFSCTAPIVGTVLVEAARGSSPSSRICCKVCRNPADG